MGHVPDASELVPIKKEQLDSFSSLENQNWYFGFISEKEAEDYLLDSKNTRGTFLIRKAERGHQSYFLSIREGNDFKNDFVSHHRIQKNGLEGFVIVSSPYETLNELVERFQNGKPSFNASSVLQSPCPKLNYEAEAGAEDDIIHLESDPESIEMTRRIGEGSMGEVWKGLWNGKDVAIRKVKRENINLDDFLDEARIMKNLSHKNILTIHAVCTKEDPFQIVVEYANKGTLRRILAMDKGRTLKLIQLLNFARQVASGMEYLESRQLVHRSLLARNILMDEDLNCKIADFGLARVVKEGRYYSCDLAFVYRWAAPEVIKSQRYTCKSDVWSFGMVVMEMLTYGAVLYRGMKNRELLSKLEEGHRMPKPLNCPDDVYNELLMCWNLEPHLRPTFGELRTFYEKYQVQLDGQSSKIQAAKKDPEKVISGRSDSLRRARKPRYFSGGGTYEKPSVGNSGGEKVAENSRKQDVRGRPSRSSSRRGREGKSKGTYEAKVNDFVNHYENNYGHNYDNFGGKSYYRKPSDVIYGGRNRGGYYGRRY